MRSKTRGVMVSAFALVAFLFAAASASALTVSPTGAYTATSGTTTLGLSSNGQALTCSASSIGANIAANGTGSTTSVSYSNCRNALLGAFTVTPTTSWGLATTLTASIVTLRVTVPTDGVQLVGAGCTFWLGGSVDLQAANTGLPLTVRTGLRTANSTLRITRNNGGPLCFSFPVGLSAPTYNGTYDFNQAATISG